MTNDQLGSLIFIAAIVLAFWFLVLRPARKRQVQAQRLQSQLALGDEIMLTSGIFGRVTGLSDERLELQVAPAVTIAAHRQAVAKVVEPGAAAERDADTADDIADDSSDDRSDGDARR